MSLYLSRLTLSRTPSVDALKRLIDPQERGRAQDAHHRLLWSAFAGDPGAPRDFLWRAEGNGRFFVLSRRRPANSPFFDPPEVKDFAPALASGDRLDFVLRANATRTRKTGETTASGKERRKHDDVVMHAIRDLPKGARAEARMAAAETAGRAWLKGHRAPAPVSPSNRPLSRIIPWSRCPIIAARAGASRNSASWTCRG